MEPLIIWVGVGALFGWWGSSMSASRGRGRAIGFLLGFVFLIVGIVIIAWIPSALSSQQERGGADDGERGQGREGPLSRRAARSTPSSGSPVRSVNPPRSSTRSAAPEDAEEGRYCMECGVATTPDAKFCASCGTAITGDD